jgi:hypothetical protein
MTRERPFINKSSDITDSEFHIASRGAFPLSDTRVPVSGTRLPITSIVSIRLVTDRIRQAHRLGGTSNKTELAHHFAERSPLAEQLR